MFEFVEMQCPNCERKFKGLEFWGPDALCGDCSGRAYLERLAKINESRSYSVDSIGGACPTQAEGVTADGRPYYFRARHGDWTLEVGEVGWPEYLKWPRELVWGERQVADGDDPSGGWMDDDDVLAILDEHLTAI